jgi:hypothetical protein
LCRGCSFNLVGCAVEREQKYGLLAVRCPSCGAVNPVDQYPRAGAWVERWIMLLAALWLFLLPVIAVGTNLAIIGGAYGISLQASWPVREAIDAEFMRWSAARHGGDQNAVYSNYWAEYSAFFDEVGIAGILDRIGGLWPHMNTGALITAIIPLLGAVLMGCFWSIALLAATRRARLATCALHFSIVAVVTVLVTWIMDAQGSQFETYAFVAVNVTNLIWCVLLLFMLLGLLAGALWGRKLARLVITALLPPRLASSLRILWDVDHLCPPAQPRRTAR